VNTPEPVNLGRYREVLSGHPEDVLAHLRERAERNLKLLPASNNMSNAAAALLFYSEVLRLVRVEGDET
jgi:hypothetical protein